RELHLGEFQRRFCLGQSALCRIELGLIRTRVNHKEQLPLSQIRAILELPLSNASAALRVYGNGLESVALADLVEVNGHILSLCLGHTHQGWRRHLGTRSLGVRPVTARRDNTQGENSRQSRDLPVWL